MILSLSVIECSILLLLGPRNRASGSSYHKPSHEPCCERRIGEHPTEYCLTSFGSRPCKGALQARYHLLLLSSQRPTETDRKGCLVGSLVRLEQTKGSPLIDNGNEASPAQPSPAVRCTPSHSRMSPYFGDTETQNHCAAVRCRCCELGSARVSSRCRWLTVSAMFP